LLQQRRTADTRYFIRNAALDVPPAVHVKYSKEVNRLYGVLDAQLARSGRYVAGGDYTIADIAIFPWMRTHKAQQIALLAAVFVLTCHRL
jgi:GST-like protein